MSHVSQSDSITKLMPALITAKKRFTPAVKDSANDHFRSKYVSLEGVIDAVNGALLEQSIAIVQQTWFDAMTSTIMLGTRLVHESGEWVGSEYPVRPVKQDPQGEGSALTYARRYALMALVGIAPEDDDGNAASAPQAQPPRTQRARTQPPAGTEKVREFTELISAAQTMEELTALGSTIAGTELEPADRQTLRGIFQHRAEALK